MKMGHYVSAIIIMNIPKVPVVHKSTSTFNNNHNNYSGSNDSTCTNIAQYMKHLISDKLAVMMGHFVNVFGKLIHILMLLLRLIMMVHLLFIIFYAELVQ